MASSRVGQETVLYAKRDRAITFDKLNHIYFIYNNPVPISVTGLVKTSLNNPFNHKKISSYLAWKNYRRLCLSIKDAISYFRTRFNYYSLLGTLIHQEIEVFLLQCNTGCMIDQVECLEYNYEPGISDVARAAFDRDFPLERANDIINNAFAIFYDYFEEHIVNDLEFICSEYMIWGENDNGRLLAGRIDALFWSKKNYREVVIIDWTSSKDIRVRKRVTNPKSPFNGEMRSKLDDKFCQLHMYSAILERYYRVIVTKAIVVHFGPERYTQHYAPYFGNCKCLTV